MDWFRWYHGSCEDKKFTTISTRLQIPKAFVIAAWAAILEFASDNKDRGSVNKIDFEDFSLNLGIPIESLEAIFTEMERKNLIKDNRIVNWEKRQPKSEAERAKTYRENSSTARKTPISSRSVTGESDGGEEAVKNTADVQVCNTDDINLLNLVCNTDLNETIKSEAERAKTHREKQRNHAENSDFVTERHGASQSVTLREEKKREEKRREEREEVLIKSSCCSDLSRERELKNNNNSFFNNFAPYFRIRRGESVADEREWLLQQVVQDLRTKEGKSVADEPDWELLLREHPGVKKRLEAWLKYSVAERMAGFSYAVSKPNVTCELIYATSSIKKRYEGYLKHLRTFEKAVEVNDFEVELDG